MKVIQIAGQNVTLQKLERSELKGVYVDAWVTYNFYKGEFGGHSFILLESKKEELLKPLQYKKVASILEDALSLPIIFEFKKLETYQRNRFVERGVYFVVSAKYVFLPFLLLNAKRGDNKRSGELTPASQYLLLSQLQSSNINNLTIKDIEEITPYKYVTLTRAIRVLEELELCEVIIGDDRKKRVNFADSKELWEKAQPYLINPISKVVYCSKTDAAIVSSYNALSHYSNLNPDNVAYFAIYDKEYKAFESKAEWINDYEGDIKIEVWKYPPITEKYVDKLSLYLTLKEDKDPRVEKELKNMIDRLW